MNEGETQRSACVTGLALHRSEKKPATAHAPTWLPAIRCSGRIYICACCTYARARESEGERSKGGRELSPPKPHQNTMWWRRPRRTDARCVRGRSCVLLEEAVRLRSALRAEVGDPAFWALGTRRKYLAAEGEKIHCNSSRGNVSNMFKDRRALVALRSDFMHFYFCTYGIGLSSWICFAIDPGRCFYWDPTGNSTPY